MSMWMGSGSGNRRYGNRIVGEEIGYREGRTGIKTMVG